MDPNQHDYTFDNEQTQSSQLSTAETTMYIAEATPTPVAAQVEPCFIPEQYNRPLAQLYELPQELINKIFEYLIPDERNVAAFRLTCRKFGATTRQDYIIALLFRRTSLIITEERLWVLSRVVLSPTRNCGNFFLCGDLVKELVVEDLDLRKLDADPSTSAFRDYDSYLNSQKYYRLSHAYLQSLDTIIQRLPNVELLEYNVGFSPNSGSIPRTRRSDESLLQSISGMNTQDMSKEIHNNREEFFEPCMLSMLSLEVCQRIMGTLLQLPRSKGFAVEINTVHKVGLSVIQPFAPPLPLNNRLESLTINYQPLRPSGILGVRDLLTLSSPATAFQFSNLRRLVLRGSGLQHGRSLALCKLGTWPFRPDWTRLSTLELENVRIGLSTVAFIKGLGVDLELRNALWLRLSILGFFNGSSLKSAFVSGIHIVDRSPYGPWSLAKLPVEVWIVAKDAAGAQQVAQENPGRHAIYSGDPDNPPFVDSSSLSAFMTAGGAFPFKLINIWDSGWYQDFSM